MYKIIWQNLVQSKVRNLRKYIAQITFNIIFNRKNPKPKGSVTYIELNI